MSTNNDPFQLKKPQTSYSERPSRPRAQSRSSSAPSKKPAHMDLLAKEEEYKRLNAELEAKTAELVREAEKVMRDQNEVLSKPISSHISIDTDCDFEVSRKEETKRESTSKQPPAMLVRNKNNSAKSSKPGSGNRKNPQKAPQTVVDDVAIPEDFGDFSLAKTIRIIEDRVSDDVTEDHLQDDIMPSAGDEMGAEAQIRFLKAKLRVMQEELNRLAYECNRKDDENSTLSSKLKDLEEEKARLQRTTNVQQTQVEKQRALAEESSRKCEGLQQQVAALQKELESMKRTHKQAASTHSATEVRLNRALEEVERTKTQLNKLKQSSKDLTSQEQQKIETLQAENRKLERQKAELIVGFKKQLKLIDILKRQKMHFEAAKLLSFTEEEFMKALDWGKDGVS
uniref:Testis expressed 9 n=1 Tax=Cyprinus carpio carpio TaxID=630221 RepID=A0A8C1BTS4_CYPCA